jgi:hypothetical protein
LFVRLAIALGHARLPWRWIFVPLLLAFALPGLARTVKYSAQSASDGLSLVQAVQQGRTTAGLARGRKVVTLSPERVAGSDVALDRGFATGPFLFRTNGWLAQDAWRLGFSPSWQRLEYLDRNPPGAILVGAEPDPLPPLHPRGLDHHLAQWARQHHYRAVVLPSGSMTLFLRPRIEKGGPSDRPSNVER